MAHFAKLNANNEVVTVEVVHNNELLDENGQESEQKGIDFQHNHHGTNDNWKQTSYNTRGGVHYQPNTSTPSEDQSLSFRKNYAGIGHLYDESKDAFIPSNPYPSWTLNESTCLYDPPTPKPIDSYWYTWDEATTSWIRIYR